MRTFLKYISLIVGSFMSVNAYSSCTASDVNVNFDKNTLIQRDAPVGAVLGTMTTSNQITCDSINQTPLDGSWFVQLSTANMDNGGSPLDGVRNTNIEGIGIRWVNVNSYTGSSNKITTDALNDSRWNRGIAVEGVTTFTDTFELVKTNSTPKTGTLMPITIAMQYSTPVSADVVRAHLFRYTIPATNINTVSCLVLDSNLNIPMGLAFASKFNGVGSTQKSEEFNISLDCDPQTSVNVTLNNVTALADATNGVLGLSSSSTARGVGIQILYNDLPVKFGSMINYGKTTSTGGIVKIPFKATYYKTEDNITPGTINATASFTMTYQ